MSDQFEQKNEKRTPKEELAILEEYMQAFAKKARVAEMSGDLEKEKKYRAELRELGWRASELKAIIKSDEEAKELQTKSENELEFLETKRDMLSEEIAKYERGDEEVFSMAARYPGASLESLKDYLQKIDNQIIDLRAQIANEAKSETKRDVEETLSSFHEELEDLLEEKPIFTTEKNEEKAEKTELKYEKEEQDIVAVIASLEELSETLHATVTELKNYVNNRNKEETEKKVI